jgi:hypothetical protein
MGYKAPEHPPEETENKEPVLTAPVTLKTNKEIYEETMNVKIPDPPGAEDDDCEIEERPASEPTDTTTMLVVGIIAVVVLVLAGLVVFRDRILGFFRGKPPVAVTYYG